MWTKKFETIPLGEPEGSAALFVVFFFKFILAQFVSCQDVSEVLEQQRQLMNCVLDDTRLNRLRLEGGTVLARIRKEEACENECYRYRMETVRIKTSPLASLIKAVSSVFQGHCRRVERTL